MLRHVITCPPGLEHLTMIDQVLVQQKVELLEVLSGFESQNQYCIKNNRGQKLYYAGEDSNCCSRNVCGPMRPFSMKIVDNFGNNVIHLYRPLACSIWCFPCCLQRMEVSSPPDTLIGTIEQEWTICIPTFAIKDPSGKVVLRVVRSFCTMSCCWGNVEFDVVTADGVQVGKITREWPGLLKEVFTDADVFGITFPKDLDVRMKAVMLGACFLIDFMFFESTQQNRRRI